MDPSYVVTIKYAEIACIYVTGTNSGEVKLWDRNNCTCLGVLNSQEWDPTNLLKHIGKFKSRLIDTFDKTSS